MADKFAVRGLNKVFTSQTKASVEALRDIDLTIADGEFVSIVGASGSGKSTLLRIIDGLETATSGSVEVDGRKVTRPGRDRAMVFQQDSLLPWRTVLDNVGYGLMLGGTPRTEAHATAQRFIDLTGLRGFENHYPHQLSGGMRQRVNVARALAMDPEILLLDEPFAALDAQTREIMQSELLKIWQAQKKTVLFITHQIDEAVYLSDRVIVFSARPGTVRDQIEVPFARPRDLSLKRTEQFGRIVDRIWQHIEGEVRRSMGLEARTGT
jgi:NitT/TauT family transport system ATP-binding protein